MPDLNILKEMPPESEGHKKLLQYIMKKFSASKEAMELFDARWSRYETAYNAYIERDSKSKAAKRANDQGESPEVIDIIIPAIHSTVQTIVNYMDHTFSGAENTFTLKGYSRSDNDKAKYIEKVLQLELDENYAMKKFHQ